MAGARNLARQAAPLQTHLHSITGMRKMTGEGRVHSRKVLEKTQNGLVMSAPHEPITQRKSLLLGIHSFVKF